jgi:hypothetical protein
MALVKCRECQNEISKSAKACPSCGAKPRRTSLFTWLVLILFIGWCIGKLSGTDVGGTSQDAHDPGPSAYDRKAEAIQNIHLTFEWGKEGFGSVMIANFTITNNSKYDVKDIEVKCTHSAHSGTVIDSNDRTVYEIVKAHATKKVNDFNMGFIHSQAAQSSCEVVDLTLL